MPPRRVPSRAFRAVFHAPALWLAHAAASAGRGPRAPGAELAPRRRAAPRVRSAVRRSAAACSSPAARRARPRSRATRSRRDAPAAQRAAEGRTHFLVVNESDADVWVHWVDGSGRPLARDGDRVPPVRAGEVMPRLARRRHGAAAARHFMHFSALSTRSLCARGRAPLALYQQRRARPVAPRAAAPRARDAPPPPAGQAHARSRRTRTRFPCARSPTRLRRAWGTARTGAPYTRARRPRRRRQGRRRRRRAPR